MKRLATNNNLILPGLSAAVLLLLALGRWPYGYYTFLRFAVCAAAVYFVVVLVNSHGKISAVLFGAIAVLFNPIIPIYLRRADWFWIDIIAAMIFIGATILGKNTVKTKGGPP